MASISDEEFEDLLTGFRRHAIHMEMRDAYGTAVELPHLAKWAAGEGDDLEWLQGWCSTVRGHVAAGRTVRRARVVSEPLSEYQRWSHSIAQPMVDAGEDIRWASRRLVSSIPFPGNDFYLFDDRLVVFLHYAGNGLGIAKTTTTDPADIELCRSAFDAVWKLSVPHRDYQPVQFGQAGPAGAGCPSARAAQGRRPDGEGARGCHRAALHASQQDREWCPGTQRCRHPNVVPVPAGRRTRYRTSSRRSARSSPPTWSSAGRAARE